MCHGFQVRRIQEFMCPVIKQLLGTGKEKRKEKWKRESKSGKGKKKRKEKGKGKKGNGKGKGKREKGRGKERLISNPNTAPRYYHSAAVPGMPPN